MKLQVVFGIAIILMVAGRRILATDRLNIGSPRLIVVDQRGGEGNFHTVQQAIDFVPSNNDELVTILINPGVYREKVIIPADKPFITLVGRDARQTVITWNDSAQRVGTVDSATVSLLASDFQAVSITFENTYGYGSQAVTLRVSGDRSAFYRCRIIGYQDTLLDDAGRHYFSQCYIEGAVDFIFGSAQSVYQDCELRAIPLKGHAGAVTAHRRMASDESSGFVFLNNRIRGRGKVQLGRAWGPYSRVVFVRTYMENIISPCGWDDMGDYNNRIRTVYFAEYKCWGVGARRRRRVRWSHELRDHEAQPFLSTEFINGSDWIRQGRGLYF